MRVVHEERLRPVEEHVFPEELLQMVQLLARAEDAHALVKFPVGLQRSYNSSKVFVQSKEPEEFGRYKCTLNKYDNLYVFKIFGCCIRFLLYIKFTAAGRCLDPGLAQCQVGQRKTFRPWPKTTIIWVAIRAFRVSFSRSYLATESATQYVRPGVAAVLKLPDFRDKQRTGVLEHELRGRKGKFAILAIFQRSYK